MLIATLFGITAFLLFMSLHWACALLSRIWYSIPHHNGDWGWDLPYQLSRSHEPISKEPSTGTRQKATSSMPLSLSATRWFLKSSQLLGTKFSNWLAFAVFCLPTPMRWAQKRTLSADWLAVPWSLMGQELCAWRHVPAIAGGIRPRVLVLHGWGGNARQLQNVADSLWGGGFDPLLLDLPAHGHSTGWHTHVPQWEQVIAAAAHRFGPFHGIVAHSLGAVATCRVLASGVCA